jgi:hypothetical protein
MSEPKKPITVKATVAPLPGSERRGKRRVKVAQPVRVRASDPGWYNFDEVRATINICRDGVYFPTDMTTYRMGMRLFVVFPYSDLPGALNTEYIGKVVRVDKLTHGRFGIAVHLAHAVKPEKK